MEKPKMFIRWAAAVVLATGPFLSELAQANTTTLEGIRSRTRLGTFSELMGPAFQGNPASVPTAQGEQLDPINLFTAATLQYDIGTDLRLVWAQQIPVNLSVNSLNQGVDATFSDPQVGVRLVALSALKGLTSSLDLFLSPGLSEGSVLRKRWGEAGARVSLSYLLPSSRWTLGTITQARAAFFGGESSRSASDFLASTSLGGSYGFTDKLSTQHWFGGAINRTRGQGSLTWDYPGEPMVQNGIGYQLTQKVWVAALLNNYLFTAPTLRNTWTSLWLSVNVL